MPLYYVRLAALSYRRNPILSTLMVLAVSISLRAAHSLALALRLCNCHATGECE